MLTQITNLLGQMPQTTAGPRSPDGETRSGFEDVFAELGGHKPDTQGESGTGKTHGGAHSVEETETAESNHDPEPEQGSEILARDPDSNRSMRGMPAAAPRQIKPAESTPVDKDESSENPSGLPSLAPLVSESNHEVARKQHDAVKLRPKAHHEQPYSPETISSGDQLFQRQPTKNKGLSQSSGVFEQTESSSPFIPSSTRYQAVHPPRRIVQATAEGRAATPADAPPTESAPQIGREDRTLFSSGGASHPTPRSEQAAGTATSAYSPNRLRQQAGVTIQNSASPTDAVPVNAGSLPQTAIPVASFNPRTADIPNASATLPAGQTSGSQHPHPRTAMHMSTSMENGSAAEGVVSRNGPKTQDTATSALRTTGAVEHTTDHDARSAAMPRVSDVAEREMRPAHTMQAAHQNGPVQTVDPVLQKAPMRTDRQDRPDIVNIQANHQSAQTDHHAVEAAPRQNLPGGGRAEPTQAAPQSATMPVSIATVAITESHSRAKVPPGTTAKSRPPVNQPPLISPHSAVAAAPSPVKAPVSAKGPVSSPNGTLDNSIAASAPPPKIRQNENSESGARKSRQEPSRHEDFRTPAPNTATYAPPISGMAGRPAWGLASRQAGIAPTRDAPVSGLGESRSVLPASHDLSDETDPTTGTVEGRSSLSVSAPAGHAPTASRADPQHVLRQISDGLPKLADKAVEIRLSPEELGHVRLRMVSSEHGVVVHVHADRPETLDLLRRHIDQLARDLAEAGHEASEFTFSDNPNGRREARTMRGGGTATAQPEEPEPREIRRADTRTGVDIRI